MDERLQQIKGSWAAGEQGTVTALASEVLLELRGLTEAMLVHLHSEEDHMQPIGRRYVPLAMHKKLVAKVGCTTLQTPSMAVAGCLVDGGTQGVVHSAALHCRMASIALQEGKHSACQCSCKRICTLHVSRTNSMEQLTMYRDNHAQLEKHAL